MRAGRILLGVGVVAAGLAVGALSAGWLLQRDIAWRAADRAVDLARRKLGWTVTVGDAGFSGPLTLRLSEVRAVAPRGGVEVFVGAVEASVRFGSLFGGRPEVEVLTIRRPVLRVDDPSAFRRAAPTASPRSKVARPSALRGAPLPRVVIEGGALRIAGRELALDGVEIRLAPEDGGATWALEGEASMGEGACAVEGRIVPLAAARLSGARLKIATRCDKAITWPLGAAKLAVRFKSMSLDAAAADGGTLEATLEDATLLRMAGEGKQELTLLVGSGAIRSSGPGRARLEAQVRPGIGPGRLSLDGLLLREGPAAILDVRIDDFDLAQTPLAKLLPFEVQAGILRANVAVDLLAGLTRADVTGGVSVQNLAVNHPWLAPTSVGGLRADLDLDIALDLGQRSVEVFRNVWTLAGLPIEVDGRVDFGPPVHVVGSIRSGPHPGSRLADAFPPALIPSLVPLELEGQWSAETRFDIDVGAPKELVLEIDLDFKELVAARMGAVRLDKVLGKFRRRYRDPETDDLRSFQTGPGTANWTPLERIPPELVIGLRVQEDGGFFRHDGFSLLHVRGALRRDIEEGRLARGASTMSMQTVKNVYLDLEKTLSRKLQEVLITWQLEKFLDKPDILETYVNVIEWGPHIYGIRQAARHFFDKTPEALTPVECIYLSTMVPGPRFYHRQFAKGRLGRKHRRRIERVMALMARRGHLTPEELSEAEALEFSPKLAAYEPKTGPPAL